MSAPPDWTGPVALTTPLTAGFSRGTVFTQPVLSAGTGIAALPPACSTCACDAPQNVTYPTKSVVDTELKDNRGCAACTCSAPTGLRCTKTLSIFNGTTCTGSVVKTLGPGYDCPAVDLPIASLGNDSVRYDPLPPGGTTSCKASGGQALGEVVPEGLTTICCAF